MNNLINSKPNIETLNYVLNEFNGLKNSLKEITSESMNFIYEFKQKDKECILRISKHKLLEERQILAELNWINYLSKNDISVCSPILTTSGKQLLKVDSNDDQLLIVAFEKATGRHIEYEDWTVGLMKKMGIIVGDIHKLSTTYSVNNGIKRFDWKNSIYFKILTNTIPKSENIIWERINALIDELEQLPRDSSNFGMVHADINVGNFFINDDITLFDFDGCEYNWYIYDIAVAVFYSVLFIDPDQRNEADRAKLFLRNFKEGYEERFHLDQNWFNNINLFLRLREYILYALVNSYDDLENLPYFLEIFMQNRKEKIEKEEPYILIESL